MNIYTQLLNNAVLSQVYGGNSVLDYCIASIVAISVFLLLPPLVKGVIFPLLTKLTEKTETKTDDIIFNFVRKELNRKFIPFKIYIALIVGVQFLNYSKIDNVIGTLSWICAVVLIIPILVGLLKEFSSIKMNEQAEDGTPTRSTLDLMLPIIKVLLWSLAVLMILNNLGVEITSLIAGLGIGGIAIALAAQSFLSDLINYFSIAADKPIQENDYIALDNTEGIVKHIGIKTVRLQQRVGEEVIVPNSKITGGKVHNYRKMEERRVEVNIVVGPPELPLDVMADFADVVEKVCEEIGIKFLKCDLTDIVMSWYQYSLVYYVKKDTNEDVFHHLDHCTDVREKLNFGLLNALKKKTDEINAKANDEGREQIKPIKIFYLTESNIMPVRNYIREVR